MIAGDPTLGQNPNDDNVLPIPQQHTNCMSTNIAEAQDAAQEQITITGSSIQLNDVIFSPGCDTSLATFIFNNTGNCRLRVLVEANLFKYLSAGGSSGKQHEIVQGVIKSVMGNNPSGRFLIRATDNAESSWRFASVDETVKYVNSVFLAAGHFASQLSQKQQQLPSPHPTGPKGDDEVTKPSECLDSSISNVSSKPNPQKYKKRSELSTDDTTKMPQGYTPTNNDVIVGKGKLALRHPGNEQYRNLIAQNKHRYQDKGSSNDTKALVVNGVIKQLRGLTPPAKFLVQGEGGAWYDISDKKFYSKVAQALREKRREKKSSVLASTPPPDMPAAVPTKKNIKKTKRSSSSSMLDDAHGDEDQPPKKKKKNKIKKDPNAPKKAKTAYIIYDNENRQKVKDENPGITFGDIAKALSAGFKEIGTDERARLDKLAAEDKERYDHELKEYNLKQSLPQKERVKTAEDSTEIIQSTPQLPNTQSSPPATLQNVGMAQQPTPTTNTPSVTTNKHQFQPNREVVTPQTLPKNYHNNSRGVPSSNKENSTVISTESVANLDRVREMEAASRLERKVMVTTHLKQMQDKTAAIVLERVDGLIGCHAKDETELVEGLKKKFDDKTKGIKEEIAKFNIVRTYATERGRSTTDVDADLNRETTKLESINAEFESEKNEGLDRLKREYSLLYEATKVEFIGMGTNQLPLSVIDSCSAKWKSYLNSKNTGV